jgi:uncharacterized membrane protein YeaQ/YmgE (transglycosylase-associated protein family)
VGTSTKGRAVGFLAFLLLGLIAGAVAKLLLPGRQGGGWIGTLVVGVVGALLGGWLGGLLFHGLGLGTFFELRTWLFAIGGALIVLIVWGLLTGGRRRRGRP